MENEAIVRLKFSDDVAPLITLLEKNFTSYELEQVAGLTSKYAVRLYEIIIAWRTKVGRLCLTLMSYEIVWV
ncbi:RepB family plasmid replication initiator protein [Moraxella lacunata]|uniref:RepB family plasmid replication initiator protein n=1 Tax=Moraxella lacunata TaxID=477 RepID=UPI002265FA02|nr:RepB family plasmid replication initiator protein [Moraxella lacunata]